MLSLVSRRVVAAASSFLFVVVGLSGCFPFRGGSADISKLQNIPEGQKRELIAQMSSASGQEKRRIGEKAVALSKMVGAQLVGWIRLVFRVSSLSWMRRIGFR